jgi:hypothetical protein
MKVFEVESIWEYVIEDDSVIRRLCKRIVIYPERESDIANFISCIKYAINEGLHVYPGDYRICDTVKKSGRLVNKDVPVCTIGIPDDKMYALHTIVEKALRDEE